MIYELMYWNIDKPNIAVSVIFVTCEDNDIVAMRSSYIFG